MIDPRDSILMKSIEAFTDEIKESFNDTEIENFERVFPMQTKFNHQTKFKLYEVSYKNEGYYNDYDEFEIEEIGIEYDDDSHYETFFDSEYGIEPENAIKIRNANMDMVLVLAKKLATNKNLHGYGLLITDEQENFFNPLHPLMLLDMKEKGVPFNNNFTIILFMNEESFEVDTKSSEYIKMKKNLEYIFSHINEHKMDEDNMEDDEILDQIDKIKHRTFNNFMSSNIVPQNQPEYLITPISLASQHGVIYPYYSIIESRNNDDGYRSRHLSATLNGNINFVDDFDQYIYDLEREEGYEILYTPSNFYSTCIGKLASNYWKNFKHMNIMNVDSMYLNYIIPEDNLHLIEAHVMIRTSTQILKKMKKEGVFDVKEEETKEAA